MFGVVDCSGAPKNTENAHPALTIIPVYYGAALEEILRAKPSSSSSSSKGRYLKKVVVSTTTGPGIPVDPAVTRDFTEA